MADGATLDLTSDSETVGVSFVMPCLNEARCLAPCIASAAARRWPTIDARYGLTGEIVVADNGSTDGSQALAAAAGRAGRAGARKGLWGGPARRLHRRARPLSW